MLTMMTLALLLPGLPPREDRLVQLGATDLTSDSFFGCGVAIDGAYVAVSAHENGLYGVLENKNTIYGGSAYIYSVQGASWKFDAKLKAHEVKNNDQFGYSIALKDASCVVGAPSTQGKTGAAYIFARHSNKWTQEASLLPPTPTGFDKFGAAVAIAGDLIVVGAPGTSAPNKTTRRGDVITSADTGAFYVFRKTLKGEWTLEAKVADPQPLEKANLGSSVATDGLVVIAGAPNYYGFPESVNVFTKEQGEWKQRQKIGNPKGGNDDFGCAVGIHNSRIAVGAPRDYRGGAVYVFSLKGDEYVLEEELKPSDLRENDWFGASLTIKQDVIFVGSLAEAVYVYKFDGSKWVQDTEVITPTPAARRNFGAAVATDGNNLVVGAPKHIDSSGKGTGAAFIRRCD